MNKYFLALNLSSSGHRHAGLLFANEEERLAPNVLGNFVPQIGVVHSIMDRLIEN